MARIKAFLFMMLAFNALTALYAEEGVSIIPKPLHLSVSDGYFLLNKKTVLISMDERSRKSASFLYEYLMEHYGLKIKPGACCESNSIRLVISDDSSKKEGAYSLKVTSEGVVVEGYNEEGLFYGVQTLIQLFPVEFLKSLPKGSGKMVGKSLTIPCAAVEDEPRFCYRGMHLDVVRHIFPVDYIKKYLNYLALHKMNFFHLHLTDDQGWRMESRKHPELNLYGAYREATIIGIFPGTGVDSTRYGGYYTIEQLKEIIAYAADRYITIVPEIDVPGHAMAILAAHPEFGTEQGRVVKPAITWGIYNRENNVLAPRKQVFEFLDAVFNELMDLFPGRYIHIGADECAHKWWEADSVTMRFISDNKLGDVKGLQRYFTEYVSSIVLKRGRIPIGWDEIVDTGVPSGVAVMAWRNENNGYKAAAAGNKTILAPGKYSYLNYKQRPDEKGLSHRQRTVMLKEVYGFEPLPDTLSQSVKENVIGGQGCMWTEYFPDDKAVDYAIFPRMSAIAENYWSDGRLKDYDDFMSRLAVQFKRYRLWGAGSCSYLFENIK